ncbi:TetR family transcriptional regulator C-terminal domain-containing protein [Propioniciclava sp. MC1595]|uniref:TetR/AcrR family transcriptional regulator n=1 Tax=unclassified Propioniciclava TaxID=2642922 RepID=UPI001603C311|nr:MULTISPECIES: TetR family transcriptional regulator C-terminal domain-containing protein [unclassified Propioniciclava]MBB1493703.1 TetR family transcriptional regulator C-terminal domain-containing protein [Propioniciclava sp. MC1595]MBB1502895.1 TetR family transcriptional regulator C-terminal domain-containing protein [Propioniciclava sp. MC1683]QTE25090.1 TetR family transcriptional regulator C-terminal domain-containing protein [Propioniciclava sp. MC1595]
MKKAVVLGEERRDAIADAAIHLVANRGLRGLTHRAVDAEVGLPPGSTSYYLRTRQALLAACLDRLLALDESAILPASPDVSVLDVLVAGVVRIARDRPERPIARYELALEATRQPELRALMDQQALRLRTALARLLDGAGIPDAEDAAWPVAAMLDGLIRDRVSGLSATLSQSTYEASVRRSVTALLRGLALTP